MCEVFCRETVARCVFWGIGDGLTPGLLEKEHGIERHFLGEYSASGGWLKDRWCGVGGLVLTEPRVSKLLWASGRRVRRKV